MNPFEGTIAAISTPAGKGGIGVIRVSGPLARGIAEAVVGCVPRPRYAHHAAFKDGAGETLDEGIALFFPKPNSFTGEDILEIQGHGSPVVLDLMLERLVALGARIARPGEFSERAFLNDKIDLSQAEAVADLIDSASREAARGAVRSLQGEFSRLITGLVESLIELRLYVEAGIDFPEDEIDILEDGEVSRRLMDIERHLQSVSEQASQGALLREGMKVVLAGRPNSGKSTLMNLLAGTDTAIVTEHEGTTRDLLRETIHLDGMPLHLVDTAGLRESTDEIEQEGIRRAWQEIEEADAVLLLVDASRSSEIEPAAIFPEFVARLSSLNNVTVVRNKIDLVVDEPVGGSTGTAALASCPLINLSALTGDGMPHLMAHLKSIVNYQPVEEGRFIARRRHLDALRVAAHHISLGRQQITEQRAVELLAEELRMGQQALSAITGEFTTEDLLGRIFSQFCIGK